MWRLLGPAFIRGRRLFHFSFPNAAFIGGRRLKEEIRHSCKEQLSVIEDVILFGSRTVIPNSLRRHTLKLEREKHQRIVQTKALL